MTTERKAVEVTARAWSVSGVEAPSSAQAGDRVSFSAAVSDRPASGLTYNYAWSLGGGWDTWGSTVKETGEMTAEASGSFVPSLPGTYYLWIDVRDASGRQVTTERKAVEVTGGYAIMGASTVSTDQMIRRYNQSGCVYPSETYSSKGAISLSDFCQLLNEEAGFEGVRPEVLFAQVMHETGWLQFGGAVKASQCNFGGIGSVSGGTGGATFADVRTGLRAQVQHLKAYASREPLVNDCVDPRFGLVVRGCAPCVEDLAGRWATDKSYGIRLLAQIDALKDA